MSKQKFLVVQFSDGMQVIPSCWLNEKNMLALWPRHITSNSAITCAIAREVMPAENETWPSLPIKRIFGGSDDYIRTLEKLVKAEKTAYLEDSTSNTIKVSTAQIKKSQEIKIEVLTSSADEFEFENLPKVKHTQFDVIDTRNIPNDEEDTHSPSRNTIYPQSTIFAKTPNASSLKMNPPLTASTSNMSECSDPLMRKLPEQIHDESFEETVLRQLAKTVAYLENIDKRLSKLEKKIVQSDEENTEVDDIFPFEHMDKFADFENRLKSKGFFQKMVKIVTKIGGRDVSTATAAMMKLMLSDKLAEKYSWDGRKGKLQFKALLTAKILMRAVHSLGLPDYSDFCIKKAVSQWLAQAKTRRVRQEQKNLQKMK